MYVLGLYSDGEYFKVSLLSKKGSKVRIEFLKEFKKNITNLNVLKKILDNKLTFFNSTVEVVSALSSDEIFVKKFVIPLTDIQKVKKALEFQLSAEEVYSEENRYFVPSFKKGKKETTVTLYGYTKEAMEGHLQEVKTLGIESEWVSSVSRAFERFVHFFAPVDESFFLFHLGWESSFLFFVEDKQIKRDVPFSIGLKQIIDAVQKDQMEIESFDMQTMQQYFFEAIDQEEKGAVRDVFFDVEREISRAWTYMVETEEKAKEASRVLFTGYSDFSRDLKKVLPSIDFDEISITPHLDYSNAQICAYAIEIGLGLDRALSDRQGLQLAGGEFFPVSQKRKAKKYLYRYLTFSCLSVMMFYVTYNAYTMKKANLLKKKYEKQVNEIYCLGHKKMPALSYSRKGLERSKKQLMKMVKDEKQKAKLCGGPTGFMEVLNWLSDCRIEDYDIVDLAVSVVGKPTEEKPAGAYVLDVSFTLVEYRNGPKYSSFKKKLEEPQPVVTFVNPLKITEKDKRLYVSMRVTS